MEEDQNEEAQSGFFYLWGYGLVKRHRSIFNSFDFNLEYKSLLVSVNCI